MKEKAHWSQQDESYLSLFSSKSVAGLHFVLLIFCFLSLVPGCKDEYRLFVFPTLLGSNQTFSCFETLSSLSSRHASCSCEWWRQLVEVYWKIFLRLDRHLKCPTSCWYSKTLWHSWWIFARLISWMIAGYVCSLVLLSAAWMLF